MPKQSLKEYSGLSQKTVNTYRKECIWETISKNKKNPIPKSTKFKIKQKSQKKLKHKNKNKKNKNSKKKKYK